MAKSKKSKQTPLQREYKKQVNRLKGVVKRGEERGYLFSADVIPKQPKTITQKSVERLKKIKPKDLYEKAAYIDPNTGLAVPGREGLHLERKQRTQKSQETRKHNKQNKEQQKQQSQEQYYPNGGDIVADNIVDHLIARFQEPNPPVFPFSKRVARELEALQSARTQSKITLLSLTYQVINDIGKAELGWRLADRYDEIEDIMDTMLYRASSADDVISACSLLAEIIKGGPLTFTEMQDLSEQQEWNENFEPPQ